ncbi:50S ribosomal protein L9 [Candidatus Marinimicrobia bacterium]|jgi:large subunit ribosomal protein L9|nr:50S ribosomal protein L9 [Candidatus Neomarinimicrobiota bacterium]MDA9735677.1 50S ribosomal protein L9 [Candidatus Neomarinimicrobiota bacterium]
MKVILKEDVQNLGQQGDVVEVKSGYARNYLMPQKLAILFTKQQKKSIEEAQRVEERKLEREKDQLESVLKQVEDLSLSLKMQSEEDSKLFGSVTKLDIVKLLEENGITIDKKYVDLSSPIKTLGEHKVNIMFTKEMSASFTLTVEKED